MQQDFWSEIFEYYMRFQTVFFRPIRRASMAGQSNRSWRTTGNSAHIMPPSATTLRKERERSEARTTDSSLHPAPAVAPPAKSSEAPPATFEDSWPPPERPRAAEVPPLRRSARTPSTFTQASPAAPGTDRYPPAARHEDQPPVTVLKSGVVDGMAYSLYSDGSIEAQMPEGMMRFASIDELRTHLDQRP